MDEVDKFLNQGVFEEQRHTQRFTEGETQGQREEWLHQVDKTCKAANIQYVVRETTSAGHPAYEFGFPDAEAFALFTLSVFGDKPNPGGHRHTHHFDDRGPEYQEAFLLAADAHLTALGVECTAKQQVSATRFAFDRFSDKYIFQTLIDDGALDRSAEAIDRARALQKRLQSAPIGRISADPEPS